MISQDPQLYNGWALTATLYPTTLMSLWRIWWWWMTPSMTGYWCFLECLHLMEYSTPAKLSWVEYLLWPHVCEMNVILCTSGGSWASEQLGGGGGGGGGRETCKTCPTRGVWGHAPPGKISNLHALRLNLEPSGGIWNQVLTSWS